MTTNEKKKAGAGKVREQPQMYENHPNPFIDERYEIINNLRYDLKPSPTVRHQHLVVDLAHYMKTTCNQNGIILVSPIDVYLDDENQFQPDLVFILNEHLHIVKEARIEGAPDLVAEILSPSTSERDKILKKDQYERFGVQEYWIVDPTHLIIDQFILEDGKYDLYKTYSTEGALISPLMSCVHIDLQKLFEPVIPVEA